MNRKNERGFTMVEVMIVIVIIAILGALVFGSRGGCLVGCDPDYSVGERTGLVTKLAYKGWAYKTWEGEMNLGGLASNTQGQLEANVWQFTIADADEESLKRIQEAQRAQRPVIIKYKQWMVRPSCQTDSGYIVQSVEFVKTDRKEGDKR